MGGDTDDLPKVHPRQAVTDAARRRPSSDLFDIRRDYSLTPSEVFMLLSGEMAQLARSCVLSEREPEG